MLTIAVQSPRRELEDRRASWAIVLVLTLICFALGVSRSHAQERIDPRTGQLLLTVTDLTLQVEPVTLELRRTLLVRSRAQGLFGDRWQSNWESRLVSTPTAILLDQSPYPIAFTQASGAAEYVSPDGERLLKQPDGRFVHTMADGSSETFDAQGRLVERDYRNGNKATVRYGANDRIERIDGPRGSFIQLNADGQGRVTRVQTSTGAAVRYGYTGGNLSEVQVNVGPVLRYGYDTRGALARIDRPHSGAVDIAYDANERIVSRRWADGAEERYAYDDATNAQRRTDPTGAVTITQWSDDGRHAQVTDPRGGKVLMTFDAAGRAESITDQSGATTKLAYDALGRATSLQDSSGQITRYEYVGTSGRVRAITRPDGTQESFAYDAQQNSTEVKIGTQTFANAAYNADGTVGVAKAFGIPQQRLVYDAQGRSQTAIDPLGAKLQISYDARGNPVRATDAVGGVWTWQWNAQDQLVSKTDPAGAIMRYEYDSSGRLARITNPLGGVTRFDYDVRGRRVAETDPSAQQTRYEYDRAGRLTKLSAGGASESFRYDPAGNAIEWTDRLGRTVQMDYDPVGRITQERWSTGLQVHYRYDARGQLAAIEDSSGRKLEWQHDERGRIIAQRNALGAVTQFQYDALGNVTARRDPRGEIKQFAYSADGMLARVQEPSGDAAEYRYDAAYRLVEMVRASGGKSRFAYDGLGNLTQETDPLGNERRHQYDGASRLVASTDAMGRTTRFAYDAAGQLIEKRFADGKRVTFKYDAVGNLVEADDGAFPVLYAYDAGGRRIKADYPAIKKTIAYEYDTAGLRTTLIAPDGRATRYEYDSHKQLSAIIPPDGKRIGLTYDVQHRLRSVAYPNGITGRWQYDGAGRVTKLDHADAAGKAVAAWTYSYDPDGNLVKQESADGRGTSYGYDPAGQLTEVSGATGVVRYRYGRGGARASLEAGPNVVNYRHDAADRLLEAGSEKLGYDSDGNLVRREGPGGTTSYEYDAENRLVKVQASNGKTTTFGYAPTGERVWQRDASGLTYYIYDGIDLIEELDEKGNLKASYAHGPGIDQPLAMLREGKAYYYHADRLGSTRALTDDRGNVAAAYDYDAHGKIDVTRGGVSNPFTFTGREWDANTRLYYYRTRYYEPTLGQFLSPDWRPARLNQPLEHNAYLYVQNKPLRFVDPLGLAPDNPYAGVSTDDLVAQKAALDDKWWRAQRAGMNNVERSATETYGTPDKPIGERGPMYGKPIPYDPARAARLDAMQAKINAASAPIQAELNSRGYVPPPPPAEPELSASDRRWLNRWLTDQGEAPLPSSSSARATGKVQALTPETVQAPRPVAPAAETGAVAAETKAGTAVAAEAEAGAGGRLGGVKGAAAVAGAVAWTKAWVAAAQAEPGQRVEAFGNSMAESGRAAVDSAKTIGGCAVGGAAIGFCVGGPPGAVIGAKVGTEVGTAIETGKGVIAIAKAAGDAAAPYVDKLPQLYPNLPPAGAQPPPKPPGLEGSVTGLLPGAAPPQKPPGADLPPGLSDKPEAVRDLTKPPVDPKDKPVDPKDKPTTAGIPPELIDLSDIPVDTKTPPPGWFAGETGYDPRKDPGAGRTPPANVAKAGQEGQGFGGGVPGSSVPPTDKSGLGGAPVTNQPQPPAPVPAGPPGGNTGGPAAPQGVWCWSDQSQSYYMAPSYPCPPTRTLPSGLPPSSGQQTPPSPPGRSIPGMPPPGSTLPGTIGSIGVIAAPPRSPPVSPPNQPPPRGGTTGGGNAPPAPKTPPVAQGPGTTAPPPPSGGQCNQPLCYYKGQKDCEAGPLPSDDGWLSACTANMQVRCDQGEAGGTGSWCVHKGADPSCAVRAQRVCGERIQIQ